MITFSINLSKLPKDKMTTSKKGDRYINLVMWENKDGEDQYGNTHTITVANTKEERNSGAETIYVGNGKDWDQQEKPKAKPQKSSKQKPVQVQADFLDDDDDLPF